MCVCVCVDMAAGAGPHRRGAATMGGGVEVGGGGVVGGGSAGNGGSVGVAGEIGLGKDPRVETKAAGEYISADRSRETELVHGTHL